MCDAEIGLRQGSIASTDTDVGLVPLLHVYAEYQFFARFDQAVASLVWRF